MQGAFSTPRTVFETPARNEKRVRSSGRSLLSANRRPDRVPGLDSLEPLDFIARLAALVPKPRVNLIRFHGVFAPNSRYRGRVTKAKRGRGGRRAATGDPEAPTPAERRASMSWAQRLKRVFNIDIETCSACGGAVRIIACIEVWGYDFGGH